MAGRIKFRPVEISHARKGEDIFVKFDDIKTFVLTMADDMNNNGAPTSARVVVAVAKRLDEIEFK